MAIATFSNWQDFRGGLIDDFGFTTLRVDDVPLGDGNYLILRTYVEEGLGTFNDSVEVPFHGYTASGDPVFEYNGLLFTLTNTPAPDGSPVPTFTPSSAFVACFLAGTLISTPQGAAPVEALVADDLVTTADGGVAKVKWIGRQTVATLFGGGDERAPICVSAGALGENLPSRDLKLTADHALLLDGVLVQAGAMVNGTTIRRMPKAETGDRYTVFHIETEGHEIILAEGCAAETFVDSVTRRRFDNYAEYEALFGGEAETILELDLPRAMSVRQLPDSIRALIEVRRAA